VVSARISETTVYQFTQISKHISAQISEFAVADDANKGAIIAISNAERFRDARTEAAMLREAWTLNTELDK